jgi:hypothetical protein
VGYACLSRSSACSSSGYSGVEYELQSIALIVSVFLRVFVRMSLWVESDRRNNLSIEGLRVDVD